ETTTAINEASARIAIDVRIDVRRTFPSGAAPERTDGGKTGVGRGGVIRTFIGGRFPSWVWCLVAVSGRGRRRGRRSSRAGCVRPADSVLAAGRAGAPFLAPAFLPVARRAEDGRCRRSTGRAPP